MEISAAEENAKTYNFFLKGKFWPFGRFIFL
jgi:hypothetical protein